MKSRELLLQLAYEYRFNFDSILSNFQGYSPFPTNESLSEEQRERISDLTLKTKLLFSEYENGNILIENVKQLDGRLDNKSDARSVITSYVKLISSFIDHLTKLNGNEDNSVRDREDTKKDQENVNKGHDNTNGMPLRYYRLIRGSLYAVGLGATLVGHYYLDHHGEPHVHAEPIHDHQETLYMVPSPDGIDTLKSYFLTSKQFRFIDSIERSKSRR